MRKHMLARSHDQAVLQPCDHEAALTLCMGIDVVTLCLVIVMAAWRPTQAVPSTFWAT